MAWNEWNERSAYLLVKSDWKAADKIWNKAKKWNETIGVSLVTGQWDMVLWLDAFSREDIYDRVVDIRGMKGVEGTSTHFVYKGMKNDKWWWEWPVGSWVWMHSPKLNGEWKSMKNWKWASSVASTPGEWDYLVWAGGRNWNDVWNKVGQANRSGWRTQSLVPIKTWWNKSWKKSWWS